MFLNASSFENNEHIFYHTSNENNRNPSKRYCSHISEIFRQNSGVVHKYIRPNHDAVYGIRKGSATYATTGTTCPPPIPSIAQRGEWSMGKVLDVYWHFSEPGDTYLGRILAGFDPNSSNFGALPPHFIVDDPNQNVFISEAMNRMFGPILQKWKNTSCNPYGFLLLCLASIVYHKEWIKEWIQKVPSHDFIKISIINNNKLMNELVKLISAKESNVIKRVTGIPSYIENAIIMYRLL